MLSELSKLLNAANAHPFLFIGSGFSHRYLKSEDWKSLIAHFASEAKPGNEFAFEWYKNEVNASGESDVEVLPLITEMIEKDFARRFFEDSKYSDLRDRYAEQIRKGVSPLKICVSERFMAQEEKFKSPLFPKEISALGHSRKNTAGIVSTNFDRYLESLYPEHKPYIGQDELLFRQTYGVGEIYKIHGCVSNPESIVLTESDYKRYSDRNAYLSAKLLTVFLEHPIFFMGYSLHDSNIRRIFSDIANCLNEEQLSHLTNRLFFVQRNAPNRNEGINIVRESFDGKVIEFKQIVTDDFSVIFKSIAAMKTSYSPKILRRLKKDIYDLVLTNNPKERIKVVDIERSTDLDDIEVVMGVGLSQKLGGIGYEGLDVQDLIEDILYDNKRFNSKAIVELVLPKLGRRCTYNFPMFKYLCNSHGHELETKLGEHIQKIEEKGVGFWISKSLEKFKRQSSGTITLSELIQTADLDDPKDISKILKELIFVSNLNETFEQFGKLLCQIYKKYDPILDKKEFGLATDFRRAVKIYDYLKFYKKTPLVPKDSELL